MYHFTKALEEVRPAFGMDEGNLEIKLNHGFFNYGERFEKNYLKCQTFINEVKSGSTEHLSILLEGDPRNGKTALAAKLALESDFPFVKLITPENYVGKFDYDKVKEIDQIFKDAYKSSLSLIILDDIERLIDYIDMGPRFSNVVL